MGRIGRETFFKKRTKRACSYSGIFAPPTRQPCQGIWGGGGQATADNNDARYLLPTTPFPFPHFDPGFRILYSGSATGKINIKYLQCTVRRQAEWKYLFSTITDCHSIIRNIVLQYEKQVWISITWKKFLFFYDFGIESQNQSVGYAGILNWTRKRCDSGILTIIFSHNNYWLSGFRCFGITLFNFNG